MEDSGETLPPSPSARALSVDTSIQTDWVPVTEDLKAYLEGWRAEARAASPVSFVPETVPDSASPSTPGPAQACLIEETPDSRRKSLASTVDASVSLHLSPDDPDPDPVRNRLHFTTAATPATPAPDSAQRGSAGGGKAKPEETRSFLVPTPNSARRREEQDIQNYRKGKTPPIWLAGRVDTEEAKVEPPSPIAKPDPFAFDEEDLGAAGTAKAAKGGASSATSSTASSKARKAEKKVPLKKRKSAKKAPAPSPPKVKESAAKAKENASPLKPRPSVSAETESESESFVRRTSTGPSPAKKARHNVTEDSLSQAIRTSGRSSTGSRQLSSKRAKARLDEIEEREEDQFGDRLRDDDSQGPHRRISSDDEEPVEEEALDSPPKAKKKPKPRAPKKEPTKKEPAKKEPAKKEPAKKEPAKKKTKEAEEKKPSPLKRSVTENSSAASEESGSSLPISLRRASRSSRASRAVPGRLGWEKSAPRLLISGAPEAGDGMSKAEAEDTVTELGGSITQDIDEADAVLHLAPTLKRTVKVMSGVALGLDVVGLEWLKESAEAGSFVAPRLVEDPAKEALWGFSLRDSIRRAREQPPVFQEASVYVEAGTKWTKDVAEMAKAAGATIVQRFPSKPAPRKYIVVESPGEVKRALAAGFVPQTKEFVFHAIQHHTIDSDTHAAK